MILKEREAGKGGEGYGFALCWENKRYSLTRPRGNGPKGFIT